MVIHVDMNHPTICRSNLLSRNTDQTGKQNLSRHSLFLNEDIVYWKQRDQYKTDRPYFK